MKILEGGVHAPFHDVLVMESKGVVRVVDNDDVHHILGFLENTKGLIHDKLERVQKHNVPKFLQERLQSYRSDYSSDQWIEELRGSKAKKVSTSVNNSEPLVKAA